MSEARVGLLHPGEMGAAVGRCLVATGHRVLWVPEGRSPASAARAAAAGLTAVTSGGLASLVQDAGVIVSVCPPHIALEVARQVAGFGGVYVDANAVSPATAREVARIVEDGGASYVDGGIIGTPPVAPGFIRFYLSGARATEVQALFAGGEVDARVISGDASVAASAVKMAYASWTKGSAALLLTARALARAEGVEEALLAEWGISQPGLADRSVQAARSAAAKGWRWVAEMEEIAAAMAAAGLPDGFHQAAAEVYRHVGDDPSPDALLTALLSPP
jgi:3-hydroxyisobutyrate dehydrogenase-like beta-hydroxyacid dehydrogenase